MKNGKESNGHIRIGFVPEIEWEYHGKILGIHMVSCVWETLGSSITNLYPKGGLSLPTPSSYSHPMVYQGLAVYLGLFWDSYPPNSHHSLAKGSIVITFSQYVFQILA